MYNAPRFSAGVPALSDHELNDEYWMRHALTLAKRAGDPGPHPLDVRVPAPIGLLLRPRDVVPEAGALTANFADGSHGSTP